LPLPTLKRVLVRNYIVNVLEINMKGFLYWGPMFALFAFTTTSFAVQQKNAETSNPKTVMVICSKKDVTTSQTGGTAVVGRVSAPIPLNKVDAYIARKMREGYTCERR
ncbi:hypothetical protein ACU7DT_004841, partial [Escherichia coli]